MTCPSCRENIAAVSVKNCPSCGARILRMESGVIKTSAVIIVSDEVQAVYPSLRDVPEPLRRRVVESTTGRNSGTIVIADRRGKQEMEKASRMEKIPAAPDPFVLRTSRPKDSPARRPLLVTIRSFARVVWPALAAIIVGAVGVWLAFVVRW